MAQSAVLDGVTYSVPDEGDESWGSTLTSYLVAIAPRVEEVATAADAASTASKTETLTNKSISGASNTLTAIPPSAVGATTAATANSIPLRNALGYLVEALGFSGPLVEGETVSATTNLKASARLSLGDGGVAGIAEIAGGSSSVVVNGNFNGGTPTYVTGTLLTAGSGVALDAIVPGVDTLTIHLTAAPASAVLVSWIAAFQA